MDPKKILLSIPDGKGGLTNKEFAIQPGTRPMDILPQLGLTGFQLVNPQGRGFVFDDDLYPELREGEKVFAVDADILGC